MALVDLGQLMRTSQYAASDRLSAPTAKADAQIIAAPAIDLGLEAKRAVSDGVQRVNVASSSELLGKAQAQFDEMNAFVTQIVNSMQLGGGEKK